MSFSAEKRERIKYYLLDKIFRGDKDYIESTMETFAVSGTTVYNYIQKLIDERKIVRDKSGECKLVETYSKRYSFSLADNLEEDRIYDAVLKSVVSKLPDNVVKIWQYSFCEMVNNAIEHSLAQQIEITVQQNALYTWVNIIDDGIGIFNKITEYYKFADVEDAILALFKGKLTTDSANHSGEGIFFTSHVMDHFFAVSDGKIFSQSNTVEMISNIGANPKLSSKGTTIILALSNCSTQKLVDVFDEFATVDGGFSVSKIPMRKVCDSGYPVSRSQAKRLYFGFDKFESIILDFEGVDDIGQGFAHELFVVFKRNNPDIELKCINMNESISKMLAHVMA